MAELLAKVAQRLVEENPSLDSVVNVQVDTSGNTYVDFVARHGVDWYETDDFGGWEIVAVAGPSAIDEAETYRVWFDLVDGSLAAYDPSQK